MTPYRIQKPLMTGRVVRVIAILFLVYTGLDLSMPQLCREEMGNRTMAQTAASTEDNSVDATRPFSAALGTEDYEENLPSEPPHSEEDCFCCCAHVLPGSAAALVAAPELATSFAPRQDSGLLSPPLKSPYHPPRFA